MGAFLNHFTSNAHATQSIIETLDHYGDPSCILITDKETDASWEKSHEKSILGCGLWPGLGWTEKKMVWA